MTSACLATTAPPFFPSAASAAAADQFQFQFRHLQHLQQFPPKLQDLKGLLPLPFHAFRALHAPSPHHPLLIHDHDHVHSSRLLFGSGIAQQCTRHGRILSCLSCPPPSASASVDVGIDTLMQMPPEQAELLARFLAGLSPASLLSVDPAGRILFAGTPAEMRDLLSILAEFSTPHMPTHPHASSVSLLVPYFDR